MGHCVTATGPSMKVAPRMYRPWKCSEVDWLPSELRTLTTSWSPTSTRMMGMGHWPLMPMTGRSAMPSGLAVTQVMLKS